MASSRSSSLNTTGQAVEEMLLHTDGGGIVLTECGITHLLEAGEYHSILPVDDTDDLG
jgi:hypothetical protein